MTPEPWASARGRGAGSERRGRLYASSTLSFLPTADAARSKVASVTDRFAGSSSRSSAGRLVFMRLAISDLVRPRRLISWAIWKAITPKAPFYDEFDSATHGDLC